MSYPTHLDLANCTDEPTLWRQYREMAKLIPQEAIPRNADVTLTHIRSIMNTRALALRVQWMTYAWNRASTPNRKIPHMIERAFPSAPLHPGKYELRIERQDGKFAIHIFSAIFPAKKFLDIIVGDRKTSWQDRHTLRCHDLIIKSKHLERMFTHIYTPEEADWLLPMPYSYYAKFIAFNETHAEAPKIAENEPGGIPAASIKQRKTGRSSRVSGGVGMLTSSPQAEHDVITAKRMEKSVAIKRTKQPNVANAFPYGIAQLATATGKDPSKVRAILRAKVPKPVEGWLWDEAGYNQVLKIIR